MKRAAFVVLALVSISCGDLVRQGTGSSYLMITRLDAASGADPDEFGGTLASDVHTITDQNTGESTIFEDVGRVSFRLELKDPGPPDNPNTPSPNNAITIDRYRVRYIRADGRNTPGVDVPFPFDGAITVTVRQEATASFTIVRAQAKAEAPLAALRQNFLVISTIAEITFFGRDQTGREVQVVGQVSVHFANWGDPD